jgi:hypothetical protein
METSEMGRVVVEARVENAQDEWEVKKGDDANGWRPPQGDRL